jgi:3-isopropylmalate/(R)-2-methylmalate dehydratase small subunit
MTESARRQVAGRGIPVPGNDMDTDRIIPARFLKSVTFAGLEQHLFEDDRRALQQSGRMHPFDNPQHQGAAILFANDNFGCGSSREHAPQAISRWGIRAVVAQSFGEIFFGNSLMIGLPCLTAAPADLERLMALTEANPSVTYQIDIGAKTIAGGGVEAKLELPAAVQEALLTGGWDATGLLLERYEDVEAAARRLPYPRFDSGTRQ